MKTLHDIHTECMAALLKALGPERCNPFFQTDGSGDWTKERKALQAICIKLSKASWPEEKKSQLHEQRLHFLTALTSRSVPILW